MECQICHHEFKTNKGLSSHIQFKHGNKKKEYYDSFLKKEGDGICKVCGDPTDFYLLQYGYKAYCSNKCKSEDKRNHMMNKNPMKNQISKDNQRKTNLKRYGVNQNTQRPEIKDQIRKTNLEKYGVDNVIKVQEIQGKSKKSRSKTCMKEHGVDHYFKVPAVQKKIRKTNIEKYGVANPLQNPIIFQKAQKSAKTLHHYSKDLYYRGSFEKDFLDRFHNKFHIIQGLSFKYKINGKKRTYHSDFYIPNLDLIVEIKNSYLFEKYQESIKSKERSVRESGYDYITIIDKNYDEFESLYC